uniref:Integrase n=1 Tax=Streptomyces sp. NBC_01401 TaxID=2903854 RepID=A0AAU3GM01_9ACTN
MPISSAEPAPARSLAELNAAIRTLVHGGLGSPEARREYERLLVEWATAVQSDMRDAA